MGGTLYTILVIAYTIFGLLLYEMRWFVMIDELFAFAIAGWACVLIAFHKIPQNKPLIIWLCIDAFYLLYSLFIHSNAPIAIFNDFIMESKPYMTFFGLMCLKPRLEQIHKSIIALSCIVCAASMTIIYSYYPHNREGTFVGELLSGAAFSSVAILIAALFYICCEQDNLKVRLTTIAIMALGLLDPTTKFSGTAVCVIAIIFFVSKPLKINTRYIILAGITLIAIVWLSWDEFIFYFVEDAEYNARPTLYTKAVEILNDYIPFGSGFASFANAASATWYSSIYGKYEMDEIWGLAEGEAMFASDAYYPALAQFGYVGIGLFIAFFVYIFRLTNTEYERFKDIKQYKCTLIIVSYILIEATSSSFTNERCILAMIILCMSLYKYRPKHKAIFSDMFGLKNITIKPRAELQK